MVVEEYGLFVVGPMRLRGVWEGQEGEAGGNERETGVCDY